MGSLTHQMLISQNAELEHEGILATGRLHADLLFVVFVISAKRKVGGLTAKPILVMFGLMYTFMLTILRQMVMIYLPWECNVEENQFSFNYFDTVHIATMYNKLIL